MILSRLSNRAHPFRECHGAAKRARLGFMAVEALGHVTIQSGILCIVDFGMAGAFSGDRSGAAAARATVARGAYAFEHNEVPAVAVPNLPPGRYPVSSLRFDGGEFAGLRQAVMVDLVPNPQAARTIELGRVLVDNARLGLFDVDALEHWNEDKPVDGMADIVFWGLHENEVAQRFRAPKVGEDGSGFTNLPVAQAEAIARDLDALKNSGQFRFAWDFRPHTHPYYLLAQMRKHPNEAGVLQVGGYGTCGFMTSWGDGEFPVMLDLDTSGRPIRCGIAFATQEAFANMRAVNGR